MPRYGDLLAKLGSGQPLSIGEQNELRVLGNQQEAAAATVNAWGGGAGNLDPNLFQSYSPVSFSTLPHEAASLHGILAGSSTIPNSSWTTVKANKGSGATWSRGMRIDPDNGRIYVTGIPRQTVLLITGWVVWNGDMHGQHVELRWNADDGSMVVFCNTIDTNHSANYAQVFTHARSLPSAETCYYMEAAQYSGGDNYLGDFNFVISRLR